MAIDRRTFVVGSVAACVTCASCRADGNETTSTTTTTAREDTTQDTGARPLGFGTAVSVGSADEVLRSIDANNGFRYVPEARAFLVRYPAEAVENARAVYDEATLTGMEQGLMALYQKCTHLGCRVPECTSSGRFECPCHGGIFNRVGEYVAGPAPRGMDRFAVSIEDGQVVVDTTAILLGLAIGEKTVADDPGGAACVGPGAP